MSMKVLKIPTLPASVILFIYHCIFSCDPSFFLHCFLIVLQVYPPLHCFLTVQGSPYPHPALLSNSTGTPYPHPALFSNSAGTPYPHPAPYSNCAQCAGTPYPHLAPYSNCAGSPYPPPALFSNCTGSPYPHLAPYSNCAGSPYPSPYTPYSNSAGSPYPHPIHRILTVQVHHPHPVHFFLTVQGSPYTPFYVASGMLLNCVFARNLIMDGSRLELLQNGYSSYIYRTFIEGVR